MYNWHIMKHVPKVIADATIKHHQSLIAAREKASQPFNEQLSEIESFMREHEIEFDSALVPVHLASEPNNEASFTAQVKAMAKSLIVPGVYVTTEQLWRAVQASGAEAPETMDGKPETARITRIISGTRLYNGHKTKGWSLKGEELAGDNPPASSGATEPNGSLL
jgi:hypothetical protein